MSQNISPKTGYMGNDRQGQNTKAQQTNWLRSRENDWYWGADAESGDMIDECEIQDNEGMRGRCAGQSLKGKCGDIWRLDRE